MKVRVCPKCGKHSLESDWSCVNCGKTLSVNTLVELSNESNVPVVQSSRQEAEELVQTLQDENASSRKSAAKALGKLQIKDECIINALRVVAVSDSNEYVRDVAKDALYILGCELSAEDYGTLFERGKFYANQGRWNEALNDFSEAIRLEPHIAEYHAWLAYTLNVQEDYAKSIAAASRAIQLDEKCASAYLQRNIAYENRQDFENAIFDIARYYSMTLLH